MPCSSFPVGKWMGSTARLDHGRANLLLLFPNVLLLLHHRACDRSGNVRVASGLRRSQRAFNRQGGAGGQAAKSDGGGPASEDKQATGGKKFVFS